MCRAGSGVVFDKESEILTESVHFWPINFFVFLSSQVYKISFYPHRRRPRLVREVTFRVSSFENESMQKI